MKRILILTLILTTAIAWQLRAQIQNPATTWQSGRLILTEGDTLIGQFNYNLAENLAQISIDNTVKAYGARLIHSFDFMDEATESHRIFYALPYSAYSDYKVPVLFEMVYEAEILSLLLREKYTVEQSPVFDNYTGRTIYITRPRILNEFYLRFASGTIRKLSNSRKSLLSLLRDKEDALKKYIKDNGLSVEKKEDLIKIVKYYIALKTPTNVQN